MQLRDDVERFVSSFGSVPRMLQLVAQLGSALAADATAGASQAAVWHQNAAAWAERLGRQHPLYRDVVQPVQLAVGELRYGLSLMAGAAVVAPGQRGAQLAPVLARLMAFPRATASIAVPAAGPVCLDSPGVQQAVADAAAEAAQAHGSSGGDDAAEQLQRHTYTASMSARLQLLRCSLASTAREVEAARLGAGGGTSAAALASAQGRLHAIFMGESQRGRGRARPGWCSTMAAGCNWRGGATEPTILLLPHTLGRVCGCMGGGEG